MIEKIKNFILNVLTFGLSNKVVSLTETLTEIESGLVFGQDIDVRISDAITQHCDDASYISSDDYDMDDFVSSGDYNFDDFITADDVAENIDTDSIGEQIRDNFELVSNSTVEEMIGEAIAKVEKPQQISMNDVVEQLVGQTEAYKGMHLKYEAQLVQCKEEKFDREEQLIQCREEKFDLKKQIKSLTEK
tara:strand:+ start:172 stop:741 length:570 start_codon:yes stop_codon:yes gene_type:complete